MDYDQDKYSIQKLPNPLLVHWILNPGLAINEILLGQRVPKVLLIDKASDAPLMNRQYVPCPSCGAIHNAMLWGKNNAFGHWLGYICPNCEQKIPCLWNIFSLLLLAILFPIWFPLKKLYEEKYIAYELSRINKISTQLVTPPNKFTWIKLGASFGFFMFLFFMATAYFQGAITQKYIVVMVVANTLGGIFFGGLMWFFMGRKKG